MVHISKFSQDIHRQAKELEKFREEGDRFIRRVENNPTDFERDHSTPVSKKEYIGMLRSVQEKCKDDADFTRHLEKEINHVKKHGTNSGLNK